jgi:hypothetical protein
MVTRVQGLIHWWAGISREALQDEQSAVIEAGLPQVQPSEVPPNQQAPSLGRGNIYINSSNTYKIVDVYRQANSYFYVVDEKLRLDGLAFSIDNCPQRKALQRAAHTVKNACLLTGIATLTAGAWAVYLRKSSLISIIAAAALTGAAFWSARQANSYVKLLAQWDHFLVSEAIKRIVTIIEPVTQATGWVAAARHLQEPGPSPLSTRLIHFLTGTDIKNLIKQSAEQGPPWNFFEDRYTEWLQQATWSSATQLREGLRMYQQIVPELSQMAQEVTPRLVRMHQLLTQYVTDDQSANPAHKSLWSLRLRTALGSNEVQDEMNRVFAKHLQVFCDNPAAMPTQEDVRADIIEKTLNNGLRTMTAQALLPPGWQQPTEKARYRAWIKTSLQTLFKNNSGNENAEFLISYLAATCDYLKGLGNEAAE